MAVMWIGVSATVAAATVFIVFDVLGKARTAFWLKAAASLCFVLTTLSVCLSVSDNFCYAILAGQICGLAGDIFLDMPVMDKKHAFTYTAMGFAAFGAGHIIFIAAILFRYDVSGTGIIISAAAAVIMALAVMLVEKPLKLHYGILAIPSVLYAGVLSFAAALSFFGGSRLLFIALVLFAASDIVLCIIMFSQKKEKRVLTVINLSFYYSAQLLIAISASAAAGLL